MTSFSVRQRDIASAAAASNSKSSTYHWQVLTNCQYQLTQTGVTTTSLASPSWAVSTAPYIHLRTRSSGTVFISVMAHYIATLNSPLALSQRNLGFGISSTVTYVPPSTTHSSSVPSASLSPDTGGSSNDGAPLDSVDALPVILILFLVGFLSMIATYAFRRWRYGRSLGFFNGLEGYGASRGAYYPGTDLHDRANKTDEDPKKKPVLYNLSAEAGSSPGRWQYMTVCNNTLSNKLKLLSYHLDLDNSQYHCLSYVMKKNSLIQYLLSSPTPTIPHRGDRCVLVPFGIIKIQQ
jgi:hypothetical protein